MHTSTPLARAHCLRAGNRKEIYGLDARGGSPEMSCASRGPRIYMYFILTETSPGKLCQQWESSCAREYQAPGRRQPGHNSGRPSVPQKTSA